MNAQPAIIPSDSPSIFELLKSLSTLDQQAIVRPNNPPPGLAGFLFDIPENDEMILRSNITDSYVEKNFAIQDNIALAPEEYTVRGLVAELVAVTPTTQKVANVTDPLPNAPFLEPELSQYDEETQTQFVANETATSAAATSNQSLFGFYQAKSTPPPNQTKQARILGYFYQLWWGRQLMTVETPWGIMTNMAISLVKAIQGEESRFLSTFTVTFKKIRFVDTITVNIGQLAGRAAMQSAPVTNNGNAGKTPVSTTDQQSLLYRLTQGP